MKLMPMDELNSLETILKKIQTASVQKKTQNDIGHMPIGEKGRVSASAELDPDDVIDTVEDILILAYINGYGDAYEMLGIKNAVSDGNDNPKKPGSSEVRESVYKKTDGMDFAERIKEEDNIAPAISRIIRIADTEAHRIYNEAISDVGKKEGAKSKTWVTMMDEKVRDTHDYLEGITVPFDEDFYTFDGDHAFSPGGFEKAENNVNCRCGLRISK